MLTITNIILLMTGLLSWQAFEKPEMMQKMLFRPTLINDRKEYYRFLTSGFIHANFTHLLVNMWVLYQFGQFAEQMFQFLFEPVVGRIVFLLFYLSAVVVSSVPTYLRHQDNYSYSALGASGATSALVFAYILFAPWEMFIFPPLPAIILGVGYLIYSSYMDKKGTDNIGHNAHLTGALYGISFTILTILLTKPEMLGVLWEKLIAGPF